jgi:hypothetical protein
MATCDRCGGYVSVDYVRVFGDNEGQIETCPDCRADGSESGPSPDEDEESRCALTFRMSEYEPEEERETTDPDAESASAPAGWSRFGRVGSAVSGLF